MLYKWNPPKKDLSPQEAASAAALYKARQQAQMQAPQAQAMPSAPTPAQAPVPPPTVAAQPQPAQPPRPVLNPAEQAAAQNLANARLAPSGGQSGGINVSGPGNRQGDGSGGINAAANAPQGGGGQMQGFSRPQGGNTGGGIGDQPASKSQAIAQTNNTGFHSQPSVTIANGLSDPATKMHYDQSKGAFVPGAQAPVIQPSAPPPTQPAPPANGQGQQPSVNGFNNLDQQYAAELQNQQDQFQRSLAQQILTQRSNAGFAGMGLSGSAQAQEQDLRNKSNVAESASLADLGNKYRQSAIQNKQAGEESSAFNIALLQLENELGVDLNGDGKIGSAGTGHGDTFKGQAGEQPPSGYHRRSNDPNNPDFTTFDRDGTSPNTQAGNSRPGTQDTDKNGVDDKTGQTLVTDKNDPYYRKSLADIARRAQDYPPYAPFFGKAYLGDDGKYKYYEGTDGKLWRFAD